VEKTTPSVELWTRGDMKNDFRGRKSIGKKGPAPMEKDHIECYNNFGTKGQTWVTAGLRG